MYLSHKKYKINNCTTSHHREKKCYLKYWDNKVLYSLEDYSFVYTDSLDTLVDLRVVYEEDTYLEVVALEDMVGGRECNHHTLVVVEAVEAHYSHNRWAGEVVEDNAAGEVVARDNLGNHNYTVAVEWAAGTPSYHMAEVGQVDKYNFAEEVVVVEHDMVVRCNYNCSYYSSHLVLHS